MNILGISAYSQGSSAALLNNGEILFAIQEERLTGKINTSDFPKMAIKACLKHTGLGLKELDYIVLSNKPLLKFERILETYLSFGLKGISSFIKKMPACINRNLLTKMILKKILVEIGGLKSKKELPPLLFNGHQHSHAASAFFTSHFEKSAVLILSGLNEWSTTSVWLGEKNNLHPQWHLNAPHSLGSLYSAFTHYAGFKINSEEHKLMGLAPYGKPKYVDLILKYLLDIKADGTFKLNLKYFSCQAEMVLPNKNFEDLFRGHPVSETRGINQREFDLACSVQIVAEEIILNIAQTIHKELGIEFLCIAGGVAQNSMANGRLLREGPFKQIWIPPATGFSGGAIGATLSTWHEYLDKPHPTLNSCNTLNGGFLGPQYSSTEIKKLLDSIGAEYEIYDNKKLLLALAKILAQENLVGWFSGRMEFGPNALGGRSIIGDPRSPKTHNMVGVKIKYQKSLHPFTAAVKEDKASEWFEIDDASTNMHFVAPIKKSRRILMTREQEELFRKQKLHLPRSEIPSVTHVDYSACVQIVHKETNPRFYQLLDNFEKLTGCPILLNTSFNTQENPTVCSPEDAYRCFMQTRMDYLVMENIILTKSQQPGFIDEDNWEAGFN